MSGKLWSAAEEISGLAGFLVGLVLIFLSIEILSEGRNVFGLESLPVVVAGAWGATLVITSGRGRRWRIYLRLASAALIVGGSLLAAILLPDLHRLAP